MQVTGGRHSLAAKEQAAKELAAEGAKLTAAAVAAASPLVTVHTERWDDHGGGPRRRQFGCDVGVLAAVARTLDHRHSLRDATAPG